MLSRSDNRHGTKKKKLVDVFFNGRGEYLPKREPPGVKTQFLSIKNSGTVTLVSVT